MTNSAPTPKTFGCHRCKRGFARLEHLQRHERSHTKEKPFHCDFCTSAFTRKDLLSRHFRLYHEQPKRPSQLLVGGTEFEPEQNTELASGNGEELYFHAATQSTLAGVGVRPSYCLETAPALTKSKQTARTSLSSVDSAAQPQFYHDSATASVSDARTGSFHDLAGESPTRLPLPTDHLDPFALDFTDDFSVFMDTVPNLSYTFSPSYQPLPVLDDFLLAPVPHQDDFDANEDLPDVDQQKIFRRGRRSSPVRPDSLMSRYGSRLPSLQPEGQEDSQHPPEHNLKLSDRHFVVTAKYRQLLIDGLAESFSGCVEVPVALPSRHALARFIGSCIKNFHGHYPFLHVPTLRVEDMNVELFLSMAAMGARYTRDHQISVDLFNIARAVALERLRRLRNTPLNPVPQPEVHDPSPVDRPSQYRSRHQPADLTEGDESQVVQLSQTLLLLIAVSTWHKREPAATDSLSIRSILHSLVQEDKSYLGKRERNDDWHSWVRYETAKRTQLVVFCFFNILTIIFDVPPMMLVSEVKVDLPCSEGEWRADTEQAWRETRGASSVKCPPQDFQKALVNLFTNSDKSDKDSQASKAGFSALAGCALIHAVIQQIWLVQNSRIPFNHNGRRSLSGDEINTFERALKRWAHHWERNQESSMDPMSPDGPVTFTSTALLRLAYIRLNLDLGPIRSLSSWDPNIVARSLHHGAQAERSEKLTRAALHCAHALSIPIKLGIDYVAQTQLIHWSNQHALCSLECAVLLAKWLEDVTCPASLPNLTSEETRVLHFVVQLVAETEYKLSCEQILEEKSHLGAMTVRLWARLYQCSSVWETVDLIGQSLRVYADLLDGGRL